MIKYAMKMCGYCVPWNAPFFSLLIPDGEPVRFCDLVENRCIFGNAFDDAAYNGAHCKCYPSCSFTKLTEDTVLTNIDQIRESLCKYDGAGTAMMKSLAEATNLTLAGEKMQELGLKSHTPGIENGTFQSYEGLCTSIVSKEYAHLTVKMFSSSALKITSYKRVTLSDQIATFGAYCLVPFTIQVLLDT